MKAMFTWTILICILMTVSGEVEADNRQRSRIHVGAKGGVSFTTLSGDPYPVYDARIGFSAGVFVSIPVARNWSIQPEILYSQKGAKTSGYCSGLPTSWTLKLDYVEVPILISAATSTIGDVTPRMFLGPAVTFKVSSKQEVKNQYATVSVDVGGIRPLELCFVVGAGLDFSFSSGILSIEARMTPSLKSIYENDFGANLKNIGYSLLLGFSNR
jgi:hypothetical protein